MQSINPCFLVAAALATMSIAAAAQSFDPAKPFRAQQSNTCKGWFAICNWRCKNEVECPSGQCAAKFESCLQTKCWTEGPLYGGFLHCRLLP